MITSTPGRYEVDVVGGGGGRHAESRSEDLFNKTEIHETSQVRVAGARLIYEGLNERL